MNNELLRHTLATIDYRFQKSVKDNDAAFGTFSLGGGTRTTCEIINHMYDVLHATRIFVEEERMLKERPETLDLSGETERFNNELQVLDEVFSKKPLEVPYAKRLIQGPLSDILTHIGQISMMSRLYGNPKAWEDFSAAEI